MTPTPDTLRAKLEKLAALADRGEAGEAANARAALERFMQRHGFTAADLDTEARARAWFKRPPGEFGRRLTSQVIIAVCGRDRPLWQSRFAKHKGHTGADCTPAEAIEIRLRLETYWPALQREFADAFSAFIHAQDIFPPADDAAPAPPPMDPARLAKLAAMAGHIPRVAITQRLPG